MWDIIDGSSEYDEEDYKLFTIGDLIKACEANPSLPVYFVGTEASPGGLGSWRGSYHLPAIEPVYHANYTGREVAYKLKQGLKETHYGYKGGEYDYCEHDQFYVAEYGCSSEFKVVKAEEFDGKLILFTKIDPY